MGTQVKSTLTTVRNKCLLDLCTFKLHINEDPIPRSILYAVTAYIKMLNC